MDDSRDRIVRKGDYVYGSFVKPESVDGYINGVNPGDRADVLGRFSFSQVHASEAVEFADVGARAWRRFPLPDRAAAVRRYRDQVARSQERLARMVSRETGKPLWESRQEVLASVRALDLLLDKGVRMLSPTVIEEIGARSDRVPRGVVGLLCPSNFPLLIPTMQGAAALLAGNAVVAKPSKFTPGVGQLLAELWDRCRLPRGVYNMVQGPGTVVGQRLVLHPLISVLSVAGSYATAATIQRMTAERSELPVVVQSGGKATAIVLDDAELDRAVYEVMVGAFLTAGQRHNSTARVLVTDRIYDAFVSRLVKQSKRLSVGYGFDADVFMGPLLSESLRARYKRYARQLAVKGHTPLLDAQIEKTSRRGFYARPAIFSVDWEGGQPFLGDEPPGPLLLVYRVGSWREAADLHNQSVYRLATSVFTQPDNPALPELKARLRTGAINLNRGTIGASLRLPSVGLGRSSNGVSGGLELLYTFSYPRAQLTEGREFSSLPVLPGTHWAQSTPVEPVIEIEETEEEDLSEDLELTLD